jgi:hypothetical protein
MKWWDLGNIYDRHHGFLQITKDCIFSKLWSNIKLCYLCEQDEGHERIRTMAAGN